MKNQLSCLLRVATSTVILFALAALTAVAQGPEIKAQIQQSAAANKERLAHYTWQETQTVSLKGEVKGTTLYQVQMGPDGKPQKTDLSPPPPPPSGGRMKQQGLREADRTTSADLCPTQWGEAEGRFPARQCRDQ